MSDLTTRILHALARPSYTPVKPKVLVKRLDLPDEQYPEFRRTAARARPRPAGSRSAATTTLRAADPHGTVVGIYRRTRSGHGFVRPHAVDGDVRARRSSSARTRRSTPPPATR